VTISSRSSGKARPIARIRLEKARLSDVAARERPPVFHVFEELYARTVREMEIHPRAGTLASGRP
jgi:hypothetical protein